MCCKCFHYMVFEVFTDWIIGILRHILSSGHRLNRVALILLVGWRIGVI